MIRLKNLIFISFLCFMVLISACTPEAAPVYTIIQGKVPSNTEGAQYRSGANLEDLTLGADGTFMDTLEIMHPQYVNLALGGLSTRIYLTPGDVVTINGDSTLSFKGNHSVENEYLYQFYLDEEARRGFEYQNHEKIFKKGEVEYIQFRDSIKSVQLSKLAQLPTGTESFQDFHRKDIEYQHHYDVARYPDYYSYFFNDYEPTDLIADFQKNVSLNEEIDAQTYLGYRSLVNFILDKQIMNLADSTLSPLEADLAVLKEISSPTIMHDRLVRSLNNFTADDEDMEGTRDMLLSMAKLERTKEEIREHYNVISQLKPGNPAPSFDFVNYAGGKTKLSDLKGKYVLIDVWATWCGPCIVEIPHLKAMEEEFHDANIEFVSISVDELRSEETWRNMIKNKELGGTQLLADNGWRSNFIENYGVRGIPHFILLDTEGNFITAKAERPSDPKLKERLEALDS